MDFLDFMPFMPFMVIYGKNAVYAFHAVCAFLAVFPAALPIFAGRDIFVY